LKKCNTYISMNKLILTGLLAAGAMTHIQGAQFAGQENQQQDPKDKSRRPNILFILSDDHTSQAWGIYGGVLADYAYNSNIRRLANEGVVLDNCFQLYLRPQPRQYPHRTLQSPERALYVSRFVGYFNSHTGNRPASQRLQYRTCR
jgi:hypothetical protein